MPPSQTAKGISGFLGSILAKFEGERWQTALVAYSFVAGVLLYWHGFGPGDEGHYIRAAERWLESGPFLGESHWSLRHLMVLPIAASFAVFGPSVFSATLPNIVYAGGMIAVTWFFGRRYLGRMEAMTASILIAFSPFFVARPIELDVYGAETFFTVLAAWMFVAAQFERRALAFLLGAGVAAGLAWTLREVSVSAIIGFGVLVLIYHRRRFIPACAALGVGFGGVLLVELITYSIAAGDPLYRYKVDLGHTDASISTRMTGPPPSALDRFVTPFKDIATYPMTTPFVALALIAGIGFRDDFLKMRTEARQVLFNFVVLSAFALPVSAWILHLAMPHYYPIVGYTAYLVIAVAIVMAARKWGWAAGISAAALVLLANLAADDFRNYDDYAEPEFLARSIAEIQEPVYTDFVTAKRAKMLLQLEGRKMSELDERIIGVDRPQPGALFFEAFPRPFPAPGSTWCRIEMNKVRRPSWTHAVLRVVGADQYAPAKLREVIAPRAPTAFYRVSGIALHADPVSGRECMSENAQANEKAQG